MNKNKSGQVTVFVILAILIIAVLLVLLLPSLKGIFVSSTPDVEIKNCVQESVKNALEIAMPRGGSIKPELYYNYNNEPIEYLCYTNDYYKNCYVQKPLLKRAIEKEVATYSQPIVTECVKQLESDLISNGYSVKSAGNKTVDVQIKPDSVFMDVDLQLAVERNDEKKIYDKFSTEFNSQIYEMIILASTITNWEATVGDADPTGFMALYHNLQIEKKKQGDGTTIYIMKNLDTEETFQFASRSLVYPPGY